ncbi:MAG: histidine ammonia-lyase [Planctomycetota bacterium]|nr:histidine ammonia-lyase [Planctomycetota bacterium]
MSEPIVLDGSPLSTREVMRASAGSRIELAQSAADHMDEMRSRMLVAANRAEPIYGVNTGFGSFAHVRIENDALQALQENIVLSHAAGMDAPLPKDIVRAMMVVCAASLARGHSGARSTVARALIAHVNAGIIPVVPSVGSVGASGDLAPLAHMAQVLLGRGMVDWDGRVTAARFAQKATETDSIVLEAKEGLALLNGTHLMCATGALFLEGADRLIRAAQIATAMAIDGCRATDAFLDGRIHAVRNQHGQQLAAHRIRQCLEGSSILPSHTKNDPRVQDPYSFRCAPQVLGAAMDALTYMRSAFEHELGAVTDNPLVFDRDGHTDVLSGGNFHGMPLAIPLDTARVALAHVAGISERRTFWALSGQDRVSGIPSHLAANGGLQSGYMVAQYTAAAACNELQVLAHPASVHNISTCAGIEDYNSMGATSARFAMRSLHLAQRVVAIEFLCMAEALKYHEPLLSGTRVQKAREVIRSAIGPLAEDRSPAPDIEAIAMMIETGRFDAIS